MTWIPTLRNFVCIVMYKKKQRTEGDLCLASVLGEGVDDLVVLLDGGGDRAELCHYGAPRALPAALIISGKLIIQAPTGNKTG